MVSILLLAACAPKHPDQALRRQAAKANRALEAATPAALSDDRYAIPASDAVSAAVAMLEATSPVVVVSATSAATDWSWSGTSGVDGLSEYFDQRKFRSVVNVSADGPEVRVFGQSVSATRQARPDGVRDWIDAVGPLDLATLNPRLVELEAHHLRNLRSTGAAVLDHFAAALPSEYEVAERTDTLLRAETSSTLGKAGKKGATAAWDARETLEVQILADGALRVVYRKDDRFTLGGGDPGEWEPATVSDAPGVDWTLAALRKGFAAGHLSFGPPRLAVVAERALPLSEPPPLPRVRTIQEVQAIVTTRAIANRVGRFNVCVDVILVNPTTPNGTSWDMPGLDTALQVVEGTANVTAGALGEINQVADSIPFAGEALDAAVYSYTGGTVDRHRAEVIAAITGKLAGWAGANLGFAPDVVGSYSVGHNAQALIATQNQLQSEQHACATADFMSGRPSISVQILDQDANVSDPIGSCSYSLDDVITRGAVGIACGYARVFPSAEFLWSLDQVNVVGLPAPEPEPQPPAAPVP